MFLSSTISAQDSLKFGNFFSCPLCLRTRAPTYSTNPVRRIGKTDTTKFATVDQSCSISLYQHDLDKPHRLLRPNILRKIEGSNLCTAV
ncbi:hypothetical protein K449DRAFT_383773 [Hypoxylon sp. EC38]|nr:hypothetical protein K449DRAFT_383773 [Hypoxylon sp. EC38]